MLKRYQSTFGHALLAVDACVMVLAWCAAYWLRFHFPFPVPAFLEVTKGFPGFATYAALFPLVAGIWIAVLFWMGAYDARRMLGRRTQIVLVLRAHAVALLLFVCLTYFLEGWKYSRLVMIYFGVIGAGAMIMNRTIVRTIVDALRARGFYLRNVLAIGDGLALQLMIERFERFPELGLRIVGRVTQDDSPIISLGVVPVVGHLDDVREVLERTRPDEVLISLSAAHGNEMARLLDLLKDETIDVCVVPDVHQYATLGCNIEDFDGLPIVRINDSPVIG